MTLNGLAGRFSLNLNISFLIPPRSFIVSRLRSLCARETPRQTRPARLCGPEQRGARDRRAHDGYHPCTYHPFNSVSVYPFHSSNNFIFRARFISDFPVYRTGKRISSLSLFVSLPHTPFPSLLPFIIAFGFGLLVPTEQNAPRTHTPCVSICLFLFISSFHFIHLLGLCFRFTPHGSALEVSDSVYAMPSRKSAGISDSNWFPFCVLSVGFKVIEMFVFVQPIIFISASYTFARFLVLYSSLRFRFSLIS